MIARKLTSGNYRYSIKKKDEKGVAREKYIPREDQQVAENLAMRHYAKQRIKDLEREKQILNEYIDFCCKERHADRYLKMHPDITALNITSLEPIYIEHQGGWDQIAYVSKLSQRAELLQKAGIIPWKNFKGCSDYSRMT